MNKKLFAAIVFILLSFLFFTIMAGTLPVMYTYELSNLGTVKAVGLQVFWDSGCTQEVTAIDWGVVEPSQSVTKIIYLKNTGNTPVSLTFSTSNWDPPHANIYITLSWNFTGTLIDVSPVELVLAVAASVNVTSFSFIVTITAEG